MHSSFPFESIRESSNSIECHLLTTLNHEIEGDNVPNENCEERKQQHTTFEFKSQTNNSHTHTQKWIRVFFASYTPKYFIKLHYVLN